MHCLQTKPVKAFDLIISNRNCILNSKFMCAAFKRKRQCSEMPLEYAPLITRFTVYACPEGIKTFLSFENRIYHFILYQGKDEFLGRIAVQPLVKLEGGKPPPARLLWLPIIKGGRQCGELLAAFELFLVRVDRNISYNLLYPKVSRTEK